MQYTVLLSKTEKTKEIEQQEQDRFIKSILEALEVPIEFDPDIPQTIEQKRKFRQELRDFKLQIINDIDGGVKIFVGDDLIAEWYKSSYKLKQDLSQVNPNDKLYLEMQVNFWSMFEDEENQM